MDRRTIPRSAALDDAMRALRAHLERRAVGDSANDPLVQKLIARVASEGRAAGISAEHVVIAFRRLWDDARPVVPRNTPTQLGGLRWRTVAGLIADYYANSPEPGDTTPA
jgi:hypothetical protein